MKGKPFKILNLIMQATNEYVLSLKKPIKSDLLAQNIYFSRGKGMNNQPRRISRKHMAIKRASITARNIKKHGR